MKNKAAFIAILSTSLLMCGCPKTNNKTQITFGSYVDSSLRVINQAKLQEMVTNKQSFIIAVSPKTAGCMCWHDFKAILESYVKSEHMIVYEINYTSFFDQSGNALDRFGLEIHENEETFAIFDNGSLKASEIYNSSNSIFKQKSAFETYMDNHILKPHMYFVDLDGMEKHLEEDKTAIIYFARNNCPDCAYVDTHFLNTYSFKENAKMYIIDCETIGIREYVEGTSTLTPESAQKWQEFKDDYQLSDKYNSDFGYNTGYVPTFQVRTYDPLKFKKSEVKTAAVYFNDGTIREDNGQYTLTDSFYSLERKDKLGYECTILKSRVLTRDEVSIVEYQDGEGQTQRRIRFRQDAQAKYHDANLKNFLDYSYENLVK